MAGGCAEERHEDPKWKAVPAVSSAESEAEAALPQETKEVAVAREPAARPLVAASSTGSTVQLASLEGRDLALVVDEDARAVRLIDAENLTEQGHVALGGRPSQLVVAADGRAYVALRDESRVVALEVGSADELSLTEVATIAVAPEPVALATDPKGQLLVVTSAWGAKLASYDVKTHSLQLDVALPREPRGVAVSSDGTTAHVAHAVGSRISRVSLTDETTSEITLAGSDFTPRPRRRRICRIPFRPDIEHDIWERSGMGDHIIHERDAVQGFAIATVDDRVFVPQVLVHRGEVVVGGYGSGTSESFPAHQPTLAVVDGEHTWLRVPNQAVRADKSRYNFAGGMSRNSCFLPRAAAADPASRTVLVGCMGTDEVRIIDSNEKTSLTRGTKARWKVPSGPTGIAVDSKRKRALVWAQFAQQLAVIPLVAPEPSSEEAAEPSLEQAQRLPKLPQQQVATKALALRPIDGDNTLSATALKGRKLFHGAGDRRISADGRACASCHPDGREDGLVWPTPFGARQTPMLAGRLAEATMPFGWQGDAETVKDHVKDTFTRLGGTGLSGADFDALITYCHEMATPPRLAVGDAKLVAQGKNLFYADTVGCASCHKDGGGSDGIRHEVGSGPKLDTPSLRFVAGTAPYFHDGRYKDPGGAARALPRHDGVGHRVDRPRPEGPRSVHPHPIAGASIRLGSASLMITTHAQLTATIEDVLMKVEKVIMAMNSNPNLQNAKRHLQELNREVKKNTKPSKLHVKRLNEAAKTLRSVPMRMPDLDNQLWDIEDYVESL